MRGYRSIYDSYQLANSSAIPLYEGSAAPEALQVAQQKQGVYDAAQAGAFNVQGNLDNVQSLDKDKTLAMQLRQSVQDKLGEFSKRGDYENMLPAVQQLSGEFMNRARELAMPMQQYQEWNKTLDDKDKNLTPDQKNGLRAMAMDSYGGLKKGVNGRYEGKFAGPDIAANIDKVKWVNEVMKDVVVQKGGSEGYFDGNGEFMIKQGSKYEKLSRAQIQTILGNAAGMDQGLQADLKQSGSIAGFHWGQASPDQLSDAGKKKVQEYMGKGYDQKTAMHMAGSELEQSRIMNDLLGYGMNKYQQDNHWSTVDLTAKPSASRQPKEGENPFMVQGPDAKALPDEADYGKVTANIKDWTTQSATLSKQIANIDQTLSSKGVDPDTRTQLETHKTELQSQLGGLNLSLNRANGMMEGAKNQTALDMGYRGGYKEFQQSAAASIKDEVAKTMQGKAVVTPSGVRITASDIAQAIADGRVKPEQQYVPGGESGQGATINTGLIYTTTDGKQIKLGRNSYGVQLADKLDYLTGSKISRVDELNSKLEKNYKSNIQNHGVSSNYISLSEDDRKQLTSTLSGARGGIKFTLPGDYQNELSEKDAKNNLATFEVQDIRGVAPNGMTIVSVQGYDKDKNPTQQYEAQMSNSNIGRVMGAKWMKANVKGNAPEAAQAAMSIQPGSGASIVSTTPVGSSIDLGEAEGHGKVRLKPVTVNGKTYFNVVDSSGTILSDSKGNKFQTTDIGVAGNWVDFFKH